MIQFLGKLSWQLFSLLVSGSQSIKGFQSYYFHGKRRSIIRIEKSLQINDDCIFICIDNINIDKTLNRRTIRNYIEIFALPVYIQLYESKIQDVVSFFNSYQDLLFDLSVLSSIYSKYKISSFLLNDRYKIIKEITRGGMGIIYLVEDTLLYNREFVCKELIDSSNQEYLQSFIKEIEILSKLNHQCIPHIYDHFKDNNRIFIIMELIKGETLEEIMKRKKGRKFKEVFILRKMLPILSALDYLHSQNPLIVYRDLKPSNIMITEKGKVKLIDFGISRFFKSGSIKDTVQFGSPGFSSPEQYGKGQTDHRSDIYSFGSTLHYLISGVDPSLNPFVFNKLNISDKCFRIIKKCINNNPFKRYTSVKYLKREIEKII